MSGLAKRIRQARESKNLSLEDVERTLRIRRRYLMAIEAGDYGRLPDGPASRGFVKNFARHVGIDPEEALSLFEAEFGIPELHLKEDIPPPPEREQKESEYTRLVAPDLRWTGNIPSADSAALDNEEVLDDFEMGVGVTVPEISRLDGTTGRAVVIRPHREPRAARSSFRMRTGKRVVGLDTDFDPPKRAVNRPSMNKLGAGMLDQSADLLRLLGYIAAGLAGLAVLFFLVLPFAQNVVSSIGAWWNNTPATRVTTAAAATAVIPDRKNLRSRSSRRAGWLCLPRRRPHRAQRLPRHRSATRSRRSTKPPSPCRLPLAAACNWRLTCANARRLKSSSMATWSLTTRRRSVRCQPGSPHAASRSNPATPAHLN